LAVRAAHFLATSAVTADALPFMHPTAMQTNPTSALSNFTWANMAYQKAKHRALTIADATSRVRASQRRAPSHVRVGLGSGIPRFRLDVRFGPVCGLKSDIPLGPRSASSDRMPRKCYFVPTATRRSVGTIRKGYLPTIAQSYRGGLRQEGTPWDLRPLWPARAAGPAPRRSMSGRCRGGPSPIRRRRTGVSEPIS
jgi:hypothetical protein